jgi:chromosome segregation protein
MRLRALRLHGFKSFADRTEVVFHDGMTAVVGPNGCGKSNISDAIRWVLGEQRPSAIRGAKMEEAIFQGTVTRRPVNRGSVALEVSNEDGTLPVPYAEVEISRTVYRDGGSEYQLNRSHCRLKDIQELCRDTGLGANAYSIIESRMIDTILSDRAEERRGLFEEAAGIGKYKDRRRAAGRRLDRAEIDLQRLEDLMGEVESKVRSLARQKGKAERWAALRKERLDAEVSLARRQLEGLEARRREIRTLLDSDASAETVRSSGVQAAEARVETLRTERLRLERLRSEAAKALDTVRSELAEWERRLAVSGERGENATHRLGRIHGERQEAIELRDRALEDREGIVAEEAGMSGALERLSEELEESRGRAERAREALAGVRAELERAEAREREIARREAQLAGDAEAADAQIREMEERGRLFVEEEATARADLGELDDQGDLFSDHLLALGAEAEEAAARVREARAALDGLRAGVDALRQEEIAAQEARASVTGRLAALERMEADREGMDPVVRSLLAAKLEGVHGVLADFVEASSEVAGAVERTLGPLARALVVRDRSAARAVAGWFREHWKKGGGLLLLPLDGLPATGKAAAGKGALLERTRAHGAGAPWVRVLLAGASIDGDEAADPSDGILVDAQGVYRVGNPMGATGILERKEQLRALRIEAVETGAAAARAGAAREEAQTALREGEERVDALTRSLRAAEDAHREARSEAAARDARRDRVLRILEDAERQRELARTTAERARERATAARTEAATLAGERERLAAERATAAGLVQEAQEGWEAARGEASRVEVEAARLQAQRIRLTERLGDLDRTVERSRARLEALEREETEARTQVEESARLRREGEEATRALFDRRDAAALELQRHDEGWTSLEETLATAERSVREARDAERAAQDHRHRLELEAGELEGRIGRIQERLEGEWGRTLARLLDEAEPLDGTEEELRTRAREVAEALDRLGPVNQLAVEEHEEESARLTFLREQHGDLVKARNDLKAAIREINLTATRLFHETFEEIREHFRATFQRLFQGGECDLWLSDPEDPLDSPIEIHASPRGKRTQRIDLLSGGERALTALSLLFGIYLVKPSPFCVLDEVDAPLDESNIGRFIHLLEEFKADTQFVVITHNPRTIEAADWIYGVTMEEPGVSRIVGVKLEDALQVAGAGAAAG